MFMHYKQQKQISRYLLLTMLANIRPMTILDRQYHDYKPGLIEDAISVNQKTVRMVLRGSTGIADLVRQCGKSIDRIVG